MSEENKALVRRVYEEVWNKGNLAAIDEIYAADVINHTQPPGLPKGAKGGKVFTGMYLRAFPDTKMTVEQQIAEGDKIVTRWIAQGTHQGELMGIPATGKQVTVTGITINRIAGGRIVETWDEFDQMGMMQQLGAIPTPGQ
jgi:steroid delta-isomerase-like uncharacterized protein